MTRTIHNKIKQSFFISANARGRTLKRISERKRRLPTESSQFRQRPEISYCVAQSCTLSASVAFGAGENKMKVRRAIFVGLICGQMRSLGHAVHLKACSIQTRLGRHSAVPSGLVAMPMFPALKRRAILMMSLRDRERSPTG